MKETHYKLKHRVTALFAAAVMLCSMLPGAAFAEEHTPQPTEETVQMEQQTEPSETDNGQTDESSPDPGEDVTEATPETAEEQPAEEEISAAVVGAELYTDLPNAPIGSYIGSEGLPVATGETKIGICEWPESQLEETSDSYLTAAALDNDGLTMAAPLLDGTDHYGNQIRIWGGLNQLALSDAEDLPAVFSADEGEETSLLDFCASIYDDVQMYIIENFPESTAAEIYLASADELLNGVETYASARGYYTYIYNPGRAGWQTVALIGPEIGEEEPEPEPVVQEYYASWEAPAQTASGSFDFSYGIRADKIQLKTQEKVDGATIEIEPITKSGSIDGGSWSISPAGKQTVTTSGHTADDNYQKNGGDAAASWSLHYGHPNNKQFF